MDQAAAYINNRFIGKDESAHIPTWVLVAQWEGVHPHPHGADDHEGIDDDYLSLVRTVMSFSLEYNRANSNKACMSVVSCVAVLALYYILLSVDVDSISMPPPAKL